MQGKIERFGVSMPSEILAAIDANRSGDRSAYLMKLAVADLEQRGCLPGTPAHDIRAEALSAAEIAGPDAVLKALRSVKANAAANAA